MVGRTDRLAASNSAEREAVATLLGHLRRENVVRKANAIILELAVGRYANRVDLTVVDDFVHCYEIKTDRDDLTRLEKQVSAYLSVSDMVSVVLASKHLGTAIPMLPTYVGVHELRRSRNGMELSEIRAPQQSKDWSPEACLEILPAREIRNFLPKSARSSRRSEVVSAALALGREGIRENLKSFLHARYGRTTQEFVRSVKGRAINASDIELLRLWKRQKCEILRSNDLTECADHSELKKFHYEYMGMSFGPVPDDIKKLISS